MEPIVIALAVLAAWLILAVLLALGIGRAARIGERKHRDEVFMRDLAKESARLARELDRTVLHELSYIRSQGAELLGIAPGAEGIVLAADRAIAEASAAVRALTQLT
jgi:hypothetical protein